jgi:hypothetical protein
MNRPFFLVLIFLCFTIINGCTPKLDIPEPSSGSANFTKTVAIGGNYMAGYQNGALFNKGQRLSIPALLTTQFKLAGGGPFSQALMPDDNGLGLNSKPWESWFVSPSHLGYKTDCIGATSLFPLENIISESDATPYLTGISGNGIQNLAVPYANLSDYFNPSLGISFSTQNRNPYYNRIASNPGASTLYGDAKAQGATFITAWLGMEDVYNYARTGGTSGTIASSTTFSSYLDSLLAGLTANGAKGVIATLPDFRVFPYYTLVAWDNADLRQTQADSLNDIYGPDGLGLTHIHFETGRNGFIIGDSTANGGVRQLHAGEYITLSVPLDSMKCDKYGLVFKTINNRYALDSGEVAMIDQAIQSYNAIITQKAVQYNLALVDMYSYFNSVKSGIKWDGADFNAEFVSGGFFSLDGYHPNQKGYALIANEFIKAINTKYNAVIPTVNCVECDGIKFP